MCVDFHLLTERTTQNIVFYKDTNARSVVVIPNRCKGSEISRVPGVRKVMELFYNGAAKFGVAGNV